MAASRRTTRGEGDMSKISTASELEKRLSDPVTKHEIADVLHVSIGTVYDSLRKYRAAVAAGDAQGKRDNIPCLQLGPQGSRYIVPRRAFVDWYMYSVGLTEQEASEPLIAS